MGNEPPDAPLRHRESARERNRSSNSQTSDGIVENQEENLRGSIESAAGSAGRVVDFGLPGAAVGRVVWSAWACGAVGRLCLGPALGRSESTSEYLRFRTLRHRLTRERVSQPVSLLLPSSPVRPSTPGLG